MSPCFMLPYIYCLRLSKASGFGRRQLNMRNKLVMLSLAQIKQACSFVNVLEGKLHKIHFHVPNNKINLKVQLLLNILKNNFSRITSHYQCLHIPLFLDIFQFNKTLLMFSFLFLLFLYGARLKNLDWLKKQSLPLHQWIY